MKTNIRFGHSFVSLTALALMLSGCATDVTVSRLPDTGAVVGDPYDLYYDWFDISVSYQLVGCEKDLDISISVEAESARSPDPANQYVIDTTSLSSPLKTGEATIKYHPSGMVASINATAEDKTAEIASSVLKAVIGVAKLTGGPGNSANAENIDGPPTYAACNEKAKKALIAYADQKAKLATAMAAQDDASSKFDIWKAKVDAMGAAVDPEVATQFRLAYIALQKATETLAAEKAKLKKLAEPLTYTVNKRWPEDGSDFEDSIKIDKSAYQKHFIEEWGSSPVNFTDIKKSIEKLTLLLSIETINPGQKVPKIQIEPEDLKKGIPYRSAQPGKLVVRQQILPESEGGMADNPDPGKTTYETLLEKKYSILQLGRIYLKSCRSPALTSSGCSLAFNEAGQLTESGSKTTKTAGQSIAGISSDTVDQLAAYKEYRAGAEARDLEAESKLLELQVKIKAAKAALEDVPKNQTQILNDQIAQLEAERKLIEAQQSLDKARSSLNP